MDRNEAINRLQGMINISTFNGISSRIKQALQQAISDMTAMRDAVDVLPEKQSEAKDISGVLCHGYNTAIEEVTPIFARKMAELNEMKVYSEDILITACKTSKLQQAEIKDLKALLKKYARNFDELKAENADLKDCLLTRDAEIERQKITILTLQKIHTD